MPEKVRQLNLIDPIDLATPPRIFPSSNSETTNPKEQNLSLTTKPTEPKEDEDKPLSAYEEQGNIRH
jgi:hypothetical protein